MYLVEKCWSCNKGYCKKGAECKYGQTTHIEQGRCQEKSCKHRHKRECKHCKKGFSSIKRKFLPAQNQFIQIWGNT